MKHPLVSPVALAALSVLTTPMAALAQPAPQAFNIEAPQRLPTFGAASLGFAPAAAAVDFFTLAGSATKVVSIKSASCWGVSTSAGSGLVVALKRSSVNLAGTSASLTAGAFDSTNAAPTAVARSYTANPTASGTLVANLSAGIINTAPAAAGGVAAVEFAFGQDHDQEVVLRGVNQVFALNGNGATFPAGATFSCAVRWTER